jgi:hypothetical protein
MSKLFGGTPKPPKPVPMVDEAAVKKARQRAAMSVRSSGGRESTILGSAGTTDKLGG